MNDRGEVEWTGSSPGGLFECSILPGSYTLRTTHEGRTVVRPVEVAREALEVELRFD